MNSPAAQSNKATEDLVHVLGLSTVKGEEPPALVVHVRDLARGFPPLADLTERRRVVVVVANNGATALARGVIWGWNVLVVRLIEATFRRIGLAVEGRFGVYPSVNNPSIVFELRGPSGAYARELILPDASAGIFERTRSALARWTACPLSLGAVVIVGKRS